MHRLNQNATANRFPKILELSRETSPKGLIQFHNATRNCANLPLLPRYLKHRTSLVCGSDFPLGLVFIQGFLSDGEREAHTEKKKKRREKDWDVV